MNAPTVTTSRPHGFSVGEEITITGLQCSRWKRFWFFITFRKRPTCSETGRIGCVSKKTFSYENQVQEEI